MNQHLTSSDIKNEFPLNAENDPKNNNPAGSASIEKRQPLNGDQLPDKIKPETEKPDIHEMPKTTENPEFEKTDIPEAPDENKIELPDVEIKEVPDTPTQD